MQTKELTKDKTLIKFFNNTSDKEFYYPKDKCKVPISSITDESYKELLEKGYINVYIPIIGAGDIQVGDVFTYYYKQEDIFIKLIVVHAFNGRDFRIEPMPSPKKFGDPETKLEKLISVFKNVFITNRG